MKGIGATLLLFAVLLGICDGYTESAHSPPRGHFSATIAATALQASLDRVLAQDNLISVAVRVEVAGEDFLWEQAAGMADPINGLPMTPKQPFRIASVSKTFTATIVLQLIEEGYFTLDSSLNTLLDSNDMPAGYKVADLHVLNGISRGDTITVRQLLNHSSGLRDYFFEPPAAALDTVSFYLNGIAQSDTMTVQQLFNPPRGLTNEAPTTVSLYEAYVDDILQNDANGISRTQWSPQTLLRYYFASGMAQQPWFPPGARHHYSDTNYLLLGIIIEKVTGTPLATQYRSRLWEPLGMHQTFLEWYEPVYGAGPAHHFLDLKPLGGNNVDMLALGVNTSLDWGGGGLVSNVGELAIFMSTLVNSDLFQDAASWDAMRRWLADGSGGYGLGLGRSVLHDVEVWYHAGLWGAVMAYLPATDTIITLTVNQAASGAAMTLLENTIKALGRAGLFCKSPNTVLPQ